ALHLLDYFFLFELGVERRAVHVLHLDVVDAVLLTDVVDRDDVGVLDDRGRARLALEACDELPVLREVRGHDLDDGLTLELGVLREEDGSHAALAELLHDAAAADDLADERVLVGVLVVLLLLRLGLLGFLALGLGRAARRGALRARARPGARARARARAR